MRTHPLTLVALATLCTAVAACNHEPKPDHKGGFMVQGEKVIELPAVSVETQFTPEGFALNYFNGEPTATVRPGDYLILYGDYKPNALTAYKQGAGYYEQDSSKPSASDAITVGPMKGETEMFKVRFTKPLPAGIYLLECTLGKGSVGFPFRIEE
ncbi:MAG: hypothetical protein PHQ91_02965 [Thermoanaerobaculaceae bacterium]|nr:hypothetical protein [Thermoanaerobaculaceae bacterium]